ncbi:MAG TPA: nickel-dependent hydrogenase large subunit [Saprospiraceae bacterium]|nr:nickel-dependent hydrogenase large subunit [Saprospiraceae bacterium]
MNALEQNRTANGQIEKELEADIYVNRSGAISQATFRSYIHQGDKGLVIGQNSRAGLAAWPRIFSFCGGAHQLAAARALERIWEVTPPPNAQLLRSIAQAAEILQNASRWFYTTFGPDLAHTFFSGHALHPQTQQRFAAFKGDSFHRGIMAGALPTALYTLFAGQWPYADFLIPGGVNAGVQPRDLARAFALVDRYRSEWLEPLWLGCPVERYLDIKSWEGLMEWLEEKAAHRNSDLGLFLQAALNFGLDKMGGSPGNYLSYGDFWSVESAATADSPQFQQALQLPSGFLNRGGLQKIQETDIYALLGAPAEAPHFRNQAVEAGPLARMAIAAAMPEQAASHPLIGDVLQKKGASVFTRALARMHETAVLFNLIRNWLSELNLKEPFAIPVRERDGQGFGLAEAPRGALAHYVQLKNGVISNYRILSPTILNIQSGISVGKESPLEYALKGTNLRTPNNPFEVGLTARSFDTCLACNVSVFKSRKGQAMVKAQV